MDCTITSTSNKTRGFTLVEMMVATGVGTVVLIAVMALSLFSARSFAALSNYVTLDIQSRSALDVMASDIRQADFLSSYATNRLVFQTTDPNNTNSILSLTYTYDPAATTLTRTLGGQSTQLLTNCTFLQFSIFQRNPIGGSYDQYPAATAATAKLVQLTWVCTRNVLGRFATTESVQSAKIVMRKE